MEQTENINRKNIRKCAYCGSEYELKPGLSNFKNLFRKPSWNEWFILIILILVMVGAYFYYIDTQTCRDTLNNLPAICSQYKTIYIPVNDTYPSFSIPNLSQIKQQIDNYSGKLYEIENKLNSIPLLPNGS